MAVGNVDAGDRIAEMASSSITKMVNAFDEKGRKLRWAETFGPYRALGDAILVDIFWCPRC